MIEIDDNNKEEETGEGSMTRPSGLELNSSSVSNIRQLGCSFVGSLSMGLTRYIVKV